MKKLKKLNKVLYIALLILSIISLIYYIKEYNLYRIIISILLFLSSSVPLIMKKGLKINMSEVLEGYYYVYIFFSHFLGSVVKLYDKLNYWDMVIHFLTGVMLALIGLTILKETKTYKRIKLEMSAIFIICFALTLSVFWEFFEYGGDTLFGKNAQHVIETGISDTMQDFLFAFLGATLVSILLLTLNKKKKLK